MLEVPLLDLEYPYPSAVLGVSISSPEVFLNLDIVNGRIYVPVPIEAIRPHCNSVPPDEYSGGHGRHHTYSVKPIPDTISVSDIHCPRAVHKIESIKVWEFQVLLRGQRRVVYIKPVGLLEHREYLVEDAKEQFAYRGCPECFLIDTYG